MRYVFSMYIVFAICLKINSQIIKFVFEEIFPSSILSLMFDNFLFLVNSMVTDLETEILKSQLWHQV